MTLQVSETKQFISQKATIINPKIIQIGIINKKGILVESIGTSSIGLSDYKKEMFFMGIALIRSMQKEYDEDFGSINHIILQRQDLKFILIPIDDDANILVTAKWDFDHEKFLKNINLLLQDGNEFLNIKISEKRGKTI